MKLKHFIGYSVVYILIVHLPACTYDYFTDELNYTVYVPEVAGKLVTDCQVFIYDEMAERLVEHTTASSPFDKNPDISQGNFRFKLPHGMYKVICYANTGGVEFEDIHSFLHSNFHSKSLSAGSHTFQEPSELYWDNLDREINFGEYNYVDTVTIRPYIGKIRVIFRNGWQNQEIESLEMQVKGTGSRQYIHLVDRPGHIYEDDFQISRDDSLSEAGISYEFEHNYFPSVADEIMEMEINFFDKSGNKVFNIPVFEIKDKQTGEALRMRPGDRIIIIIENDIVVGISLEGWGGII